ncbi:unnamed protein product, partial [Closterium sp. NIES-53]
MPFCCGVPGQVSWCRMPFFLRNLVNSAPRNSPPRSLLNTFTSRIACRSTIGNQSSFIAAAASLFLDRGRAH